MKAVDLLYVGLGAAFLAKDKVQGMLDELEKRGELSGNEVRGFLDEAKQRAEQQEEAINARVREQARKAVREMGLATKEDIAELRNLLLMGLASKEDIADLRSLLLKPNA